MDCVCHGLPAYWQKDLRLKAGGWWECPAKRQAFNATRYTNPERRERVLAHSRDAWQRPDGGYIRRRRADLAAQRVRILERLDQLDQEASEC